MWNFSISKTRYAIISVPNPVYTELSIAVAGAIANPRQMPNQSLNACHHQFGSGINWIGKSICQATFTDEEYH